MLSENLMPLWAALASISADRARVRDQMVTVSAKSEEIEQSINKAFDRLQSRKGCKLLWPCERL